MTDHDPLLNSRQTSAELGNVCDMTLSRWVKAGILHEPIKIRNRNYYRRSWVESVKNNSEAAA